MMQQKTFKPQIPETNIINVLGAKVRYADTGKGRVVVLLHGFLENLEVWFGNGFAQELAEHYRVIAIDLPEDGSVKVSGALSVRDVDEVMFLTAKGQSIRTPVKDIRETGRGAKGVKLLTLAEGDRLLSVARIVETEAELGAQADGPPAEQP